VCYRAQHGRSSLNSIVVDRGEPAKWVALGPRRFGTGTWLTHENKTPPHMYYHAEFGRSALKGVGINTEEPQNWEALELRSLGIGGEADPKTHAPPPHALPRQIW